MTPTILAFSILGFTLSTLSVALFSAPSAPASASASAPRKGFRAFAACLLALASAEAWIVALGPQTGFVQWLVSLSLGGFFVVLTRTVRSAHSPGVDMSSAPRLR